MGKILARTSGAAGDGRAMRARQPGTTVFRRHHFACRRQTRPQTHPSLPFHRYQNVPAVRIGRKSLQTNFEKG